MLPLYEMMMRAQNGEAMQTMSKQFGLSVDQATQAMEALMPAFSTGLKRSSLNPQDFGGFMQALAGGHYADYFNNMTEAFTPQGISEGNAMLGQIFGSKDVSRAIAKQAELATGIAQDIYKRMMPVVASILMGGLFNQATGSSSAMQGNGGNVFADMFSQMMEQAAASQKQAAEFTGQLGKMMENTFGNAGQDKPDKEAPINPFADIMDTMMKAGFPGMQQNDEPKTDEPEDAYGKFIGDMFDAGTKVQKEYQKNVDAVFDSLLKGSKKS
ncbi:MAG: DUF937 domain-containing protein [Hyphomicrobiales bacterium]|nr:DUF937 domain-containing protein [Hyphomicrobiales bacterium]MCP5000796.1 DUF937 domain-containing protein [Hyphomicrobiales bacterium]